MDWPDIYQRLRRDPEDAQAWYALEARVRAWAGAELSNRGSAVRDDVVAEACAAAVMSIDKARGSDTFGVFVKGQYLNARRRALRDQARQPQPLTAELQSSYAPDIRDALPLDILQECFATLPDREQRAVGLRYFDEAGSEEIANDLGVAPGYARRIVFNGLARLRQCVRARLMQEVA
jgi:RNA polymerase sigma factor (sigma-70 family)